MKKLLRIIAPLMITMALFAVPAYAASATYTSSANKYSERVTYQVIATPVRTGPDTARIDWQIIPSWTSGGEGHGSPTRITATISTTSPLTNGSGWSQTVTIKSGGSNTLNSHSGSVNVRVTDKQTTVDMGFSATGSGSYRETVQEKYTYYTTETHYYARTGSGVREVSRSTYYSYASNGVGQYTCYIKKVSVKHTGTKNVTYTRNTNSGTLTAQSFTAGTMEQYYYVTYNSVGGTAVPARQGFIGGQSVTITSQYPSYTYSDAGLTARAKGWSSTYYTPGTGTVNYPGGTVYSARSDITLYAVYPQRYAVTYNVLGGSPTTPKQWFLENNSVTLTRTNLPKYYCEDIKAYGYTFTGWSTVNYPVGTGSPDSRYKPGDTYATNANITLYAVYEPNQIGKIIYHANGGNADSVPAPQEKYYNVDTRLREGPLPTHPDTDNKGQRHFFKEWNTKADGTGFGFRPGDVFSLNKNPHEALPQAQEQGGKGINLYAIWYNGEDVDNGGQENKLDSTTPKIRYIDKEHETYLTEDSKWKTGVRQTQLTESLDKDGQRQAKRVYDSRGNLITEH